MGSLSLQQKLAQYHEFFAIEHEFSVNIMPIISTQPCSFAQFIASIPLPFKLATDMSVIDQSALRSLQNLGGSATQLVNFLNQQSQKIDLLIGYILSQQDEVQHRYKGVEFGGGGIKFISEQAFTIGQLLEIKLFLLDSHCAIYCYGEVVAVLLTDKQFIHKIIFHFIREEDREMLVRTSLHQQAKQLQKLAKQRDQDTKKL